MSSTSLRLRLLLAAAVSIALAIGIGIIEFDAEEGFGVRNGAVQVEVTARVGQRIADIPTVAIPRTAAIGINVAKLAGRIVCRR